MLKESLVVFSAFVTLSLCYPQFGGLPQPGMSSDILVGTVINLGTGAPFEVQETIDMKCRPQLNFDPSDKFPVTFSTCHKNLKQPGNETVECVRVCLWQEYKYVDNEGNLSRAAVDKSVDTLLPMPEYRKLYVDDFETCFNETKPKLTYDNGCKANQEFTKCWNAKVAKICGRPV